MKKSYFQPLVLVVFVTLFTLINRNFISVFNLVTIVNSAAILLMVSLGQCFAILVGGIDLSVGNLMSFVSIVLMLTVDSLGWLAFPLGLLVGLAVGFINGVLLVKLRIPSFVVTLASSGLLLSSAYLLSAEPLSAPISSYGVFDLFNGKSWGLKHTVYIGFFAVVLHWLYLKRTVFGRYTLLVGSNQTVAFLSGISINKIKIIAFSLSGLGAALAALVLASNFYSGYPTLGQKYILESIATVVVGGTALSGGRGGTFNTVVGVFLMVVLTNGMNIIGINAYWQQFLLGALVLLAVVVGFDRSNNQVVK